ncbi:MAG: tripartite tricarboxylate transporter TctB family protein [Firmicutes bacterium]|nr:tripartite tricarboxylate transporter TctB family protein [Bacillota bacterium]MCL5039630.1 tripartite tricarboxylate transporter TctB family protein [Bacillota bacterium]
MNVNRLPEGIFVIIIGLVTIWLSLGYSYMERFTPGPGFFPFWLGLLLTVLGFIMLVSSAAQVRTLRRQQVTSDSRPVGNEVTKEEPVIGASTPFTGWSDLSKVFAALIILVLLVLAMDWLGTTISVALFTILLIWFLNPRVSWKIVLGTGVLVAVASYLLFVVTLEVPLPKGIFGF